MKRSLLGFLVLTVLVFTGMFCSCVRVQDKTLQPQERVSAEIIGRVETKFVTVQPLHIVLKDSIAKKAYSRLMAEARNKYQGNIEVVNITADGTFNALTLLPLPWIYGYIGNFQTIKVSGDVVSYGTTGTANSSLQKKLAGAITNASTAMTEKIPRDSTIAILSVYSSDRNTSEYIIGELEYNFVNTGKFKIVDRSRLDQIRTEQNFQLSGEVSDSSAVTIGNMLGANIVITGEISLVGSSQRLILKALDVKTAQIITMTREEL